MDKEKLKNLPVKTRVHERLVTCARQRGMTIQGLTERILRAWIDENFFDNKVANGNNSTGN